LQFCKFFQLLINLFFCGLIECNLTVRCYGQNSSKALIPATLTHAFKQSW
jgi:hypothetical protein